jgi:cell division protein FtsB
MADKAALEMIGVLLFVATLFVIGAGGVAVRHQLAAAEPQVQTAQLATLPARVQMLRADVMPPSREVWK